MSARHVRKQESGASQRLTQFPVRWRSVRCWTDVPISHFEIQSSGVTFVHEMEVTACITEHP
jgi:hypothetical protein